MLRKLSGLCGIAAVIGAAVLLPLSSLYGYEAWPGEIINSLRPQIAVGLVFLALFLAVFRRFLLSGALFAVALPAFLSAIPVAGPAVTAPEEPRLTVIWANVWKKPTSLEETIALATEHDADVIALTEFPWSMLESVKARLAPQFPYSVQSDTDGLGAIVVFSRLAVSDTEIFGGERRSGLAMTLDVADARLRFVAIHPPIPATDEMTKSRNEIVKAGFDVLRNAERGLYVGDFNTVPWSRALTTPAKDASAKFLGSNHQSTWRSNWPVFGLPLDHAFYRGPEKAAMEVGPATGSDHFPLIVKIGATAERSLLSPEIPEAGQ